MAMCYTNATIERAKRNFVKIYTVLIGQQVE